MTTQEKFRTNIERTFFASIGAPFMAAEKSIAFMRSTGEHLKTRRSELKDVDVSAKAEAMRTKAFEELTSAIDAWAAKGEELLTGLKDQKVVEDLQERVQLEQIQEQAGRLRSQLEDLVENWRANFAPEDMVEKASEGIRKAADKATKTVRSVEEKAAEAVVAIDEKVSIDEDLTSINGIGPAYAARLKEANIDTLAKLAKAGVEKVAGAAKVRTELAEKWIAEAKTR